MYISLLFLLLLAYTSADVIFHKFLELYSTLFSRVSPIEGGGGGGGDWGDPPPTSQNFDKSPHTKILSLPINVPLHLLWHPLPSISHSPLQSGMYKLTI